MKYYSKLTRHKYFEIFLDHQFSTALSPRLRMVMIALEKKEKVMGKSATQNVIPLFLAALARVRWRFTFLAVLHLRPFRHPTESDIITISWEDVVIQSSRHNGTLRLGFVNSQNIVILWCFFTYEKEHLVKPKIEFLQITTSFIQTVNRTNEKLL